MEEKREKFNDFLKSYYDEEIKMMTVKRGFIYIYLKCISEIDDIKTMSVGSKHYLKLENDSEKMFDIYVRKEADLGENLITFSMFVKYGMNEYRVGRLILKDYEVCGADFIFYPNDLFNAEKDRLEEKEFVLINSIFANYCNYNIDEDGPEELFHNYL